MKKTLLGILALICGVLAGNAAQGSAEAPLTVDEILEQGTPSSPIADTYVKGYIVGFINGMNKTDAFFGAPTPDMENPTNSNLLLASSSGEDDVAYCLAVQLPAGDIRNTLSPVYHPEYIGQMVTLLGSNEKYFGVNGLKSVTEYSWGELLNGNHTPPVAPVIDPVTSLDEKFASIPANWTNVAVTGDKSFYSTSYSGETYAAMTGYKGTQPPFDAWLISPPVKIDECESKILTFDTQVNGYGSTTTEFKAYILTSNDPANATKTLLSPSYPAAPASGYSGWVASGDLDLSSYSGEIYIGFNYTAAQDANYATWCVTNVKLNAGQGGGQTTGEKGTEENPLTVSQLLANTCPAKNQGEPGWYVKGYIVGFIDGQNTSAAIFGAGAGEQTNTNILIAEAADCKDIALCVPVQLPVGDIRSALNLVANPENLGKIVTLCGTYETYFSVPGFKNVISYKLEGGVTPPPAPEHLFASLVDNADGWTVEYNIPLPSELSYIWSWDASYTNYKASAYKNQAYEADAIAISPEIDLTGATGLTMSFAHTGNKFTSLEKAQEQCELMIRTVGGEWTKIEIPVWFTNSNWTFVDCENIDINQFAGEKIQVGLSYKSEVDACGTWEVKKMYIDGSTVGVKGISAERPFTVRVVNGCIEAPAGAEVYTLSGMKSGKENLQKGIYLVRYEGQTLKVAVK